MPQKQENQPTSMGDPMLYPIKAVFFLLTNGRLLSLAASTVIVGLFLSIAIIILLFIFTLAPQAEAIGNQSWWGYLIAVILVLIESVLIAAIVIQVLAAQATRKIFVQTMREKGAWDDATMTKPSAFHDLNPCKFHALVRILTLPINLIPVAGQIIYAWVNSPFVGWDLADLYFVALGMDEDAERREVFGNAEGRIQMRTTYAFHKNPYMRMGFLAALLEMIPVLGPSLMNLTNACAAGLWASDVQLIYGGPQAYHRQKIERLMPVQTGTSYQNADAVLAQSS